jgi:hypothetical protein
MPIEKMRFEELNPPACPPKPPKKKAVVKEETVETPKTPVTE